MVAFSRRIISRSRISKSKECTSVWTVDHWASHEPESIPYIHGDDWDNSTLPSTPSIKKQQKNVLVSTKPIKNAMISKNSDHHKTKPIRKKTVVTTKEHDFFDKLLDELLCDDDDTTVSSAEEEDEGEDEYGYDDEALLEFRELVKDAVAPTLDHQEEAIEVDSFMEDLSVAAFLEGETILHPSWSGTESSTGKKNWVDSDSDLLYRLSLFEQQQSACSYCREDIIATMSMVNDDDVSNIALCSIDGIDRKWSFDALFCDLEEEEEEEGITSENEARDDSSPTNKRTVTNEKKSRKRMMKWTNLMKRLSPFLKKASSHSSSH